MSTSRRPSSDRRDTKADEFELLDLRRWDACLEATRGVDHVYALAADMGGMGFISRFHGTILRNNGLIDLHTIEAARVNGVSRYLYTSSACIYPESLQVDANVTPLKEDDAFPAEPQDGYGWEKIMGEKICEYFAGEFEDLEMPEAELESALERLPKAPALA